MRLRKINRIEEITELINLFTLRDTVSNNYLLPLELNTVVESGSLLYCHSDSNLYIFLEKPGGFLRLYYLLNDLNEQPSFEKAMPIMTEILFRGNGGLPDSEMAFLQNIGFQLNLRRDQYSASVTGIEGLAPEYVPTLEMAREAVRLFNASFDRFSGDYIPEQAATNLLDDQRIICVTDTFGKLAGALELTMAAKNGWVSHVVVKPDYRRQGIADKLLRMFAQAAKERGASRLMLWVQARNLAAVSLYAKYGFKYMNKSTISFIKE